MRDLDPSATGAMSGSTVTPSLDIRVISLARAAARREAISAQFAALPHAWDFLDACTGLDHPDLSYHPARIRRRFGRILSPQEIAVWSSHYTVIARFLAESDSDFLLVFEDDVIFDTAFPVLELTRFCRAKRIDYIRLFGLYVAPHTRRLSYFFDRSVIRYRSSPLGAQAYLLSRDGARRMAAACREVDTAIDIAMDQFWRTGLPIHAIFPFPVIERFSPSSIPIHEDAPLSLPEKLYLTRHRIGRKLGKLHGNLRFAAGDRHLRRTAEGFRQVGDDHLGAG